MEQFVQLLVPGIQHRSCTSPSVVGVRNVVVCSVSAEGQLGLQVLVPPRSRKEMCAVGTELLGKQKEPVKPVLCI